MYNNLKYVWCAEHGWCVHLTDMYTIKRTKCVAGQKGRFEKDSEGPGAPSLIKSYYTHIQEGSSYSNNETQVFDKL